MGIDQGNGVLLSLKYNTKKIHKHISPPLNEECMEFSKSILSFLTRYSIKLEKSQEKMYVCEKK